MVGSVEEVPGSWSEVVAWGGGGKNSGGGDGIGTAAGESSWSSSSAAGPVGAATATSKPCWTLATVGPAAEPPGFFADLLANCSLPRVLFLCSLVSDILLLVRVAVDFEVISWPGGSMSLCILSLSFSLSLSLSFLEFRHSLCSGRMTGSAVEAGSAAAVTAAAEKQKSTH